MDKFKEYLRFPDIETATEYTSILEKHNIPFQLEDKASHFQLYVPEVNIGNPFILKIRDKDLETVENILDREVENQIKNIPPDHYLYTFSDQDIIDVIANQKEWTKEEIKLAIQIANERKIELSASVLKAAKKIQEPRTEFRTTIHNTASWFWVIGIFSIADSIFIRRGIDLHLPGLATTEILENFFSKLYGFGNRIGFISCLLISGVFFLFSRYGKKNKWVFLVGLIIYLFDSLFIIFSSRWPQIVFVSLALWSMITGLVNTMKESDKLLENSTNN